MMASKRQIRQQQLLKALAKNPFLTDEQLALSLKVSVPTIRLDRLSKGIPELRERTRLMAEQAQNKLQAIASQDIVGELLDLDLGRSGISMMKVTPDMVMTKTGIARGHFMFAQANTLALAVVDAPAALTGIGNVKYKTPIYAGANLIARAEVIRKEADRYFIWVKIRNNNQEVFRAKFIVVSLPAERVE